MECQHEQRRSKKPENTSKPVQNRVFGPIDFPDFPAFASRRSHCIRRVIFRDVVRAPIRGVETSGRGEKHPKTSTLARKHISRDFVGSFHRLPLIFLLSLVQSCVLSLQSCRLRVATRETRRSASFAPPPFRERLRGLSCHGRQAFARLHMTARCSRRRDFSKAKNGLLSILGDQEGCDESQSGVARARNGAERLVLGRCGVG